MSENLLDRTVKVGKETINYGDNRKDFIAPCEIMVTITLAEYRELVEKNAKSDKTICDVKESYESKIKKLTDDLTFYKSQVERLKEELNPNSDSDEGSD